MAQRYFFEVTVLTDDEISSAEVTRIVEQHVKRLDREPVRVESVEWQDVESA